MTIANEAVVKVSDAATIGNQAGSSGTLTVRGASDFSGSDEYSTLEAKSLTVGESGTGTLIVANSGSAALTIASGADSAGVVAIGSQPSDTPLDPGTISAKEISFGDGIGTFVFNHAQDADAYEFDLAFVGDGAILVQSGYTSLTKDSTSFTGSTIVSGGTLEVASEIAGPVTVEGGTLVASGTLTGEVVVESGGTVMGTGTLSGGLDVQSGGTVAPGNSVGTLTAAVITFESGSTYEVEIDDEGNADLLISSGFVLSNGGKISVTSDSYFVDSTFLIIEAATGVSGAFDLSGSTTFIDYKLDYELDHVYLTQTVSQSFSSVGSTQNHAAVAGALDNADTTHEIVQAVYGSMSEAEARDAYDQLSGEAHASLKGALIENSQQVVRAVNDRLHTGSGKAKSIQPAGKGFVGVEGAEPNRGVWVTGYGSWSETDATANTAAMDNNVGGVVAGLDGRVGDNARLGFFGGYARTTTSVDALRSKGDADTLTVGAYGAVEAGNAVVNAGAFYSWHSIDTTRTITNPLTDTLSADYDAHDWQLFAEASYGLQMGGALLTPFAGISYIDLSTDGYAESGGIAALSAGSDTTQTTFTTLGLRANVSLSDAFRVRGLAGWRHAFGDVDPASTLAFDGGDPFRILGAPIAQDAFVAEAGFDVLVSDNVTLGASYQGQIGDDAESHGVVGRLLARF